MSKQLTGTSTFEICVVAEEVVKHLFNTKASSIINSLNTGEDDVVYIDGSKVATVRTVSVMDDSDDQGRNYYIATIAIAVDGSDAFHAKWEDGIFTYQFEKEGLEDFISRTETLLACQHEAE